MIRRAPSSIARSTISSRACASRAAPRDLRLSSPDRIGARRPPSGPAPRRAGALRRHRRGLGSRAASSACLMNLPTAARARDVSGCEGTSRQLATSRRRRRSSLRGAPRSTVHLNCPLAVTPRGYSRARAPVPTSAGPAPTAAIDVIAPECSCSMRWAGRGRAAATSRTSSRSRPCPRAFARAIGQGPMNNFPSEAEDFTLETSSAAGRLPDADGPTPFPSRVNTLYLPVGPRARVSAALHPLRDRRVPAEPATTGAARLSASSGARPIFLSLYRAPPPRACCRGRGLPGAPGRYPQTASAGPRRP